MPATYSEMLSLFRTAIQSPDFSPATIARARDSLNVRIADAQTHALDVGIAMLNRTFYEDSDAGLPPYGLTETIARLSEADITRFYAATYRRGGAVVSSAGALDATISTAISHVLDGLAPGFSRPYAIRSPKVRASSRQLIARRDVPVAWLVAQYPAPELRSRDYGAMLVLSAFVQRTLADMTGTPGIATRSAALRGVGALYNFDAQPANLIIYIDGGADPSRVFATALTVVNVLGHTKLEGDLAELKRYAIGRFLLSTASLQQSAWFGGIFASQHLPGDYLSQGVAAIERTTQKDLQRAALRYLGSPTVALVLPRGQLPSVNP